MTTGIQEYAPTSVTSYNRVKPGTVGVSGVVKVTVASTTATESFGLASLTADVTGTLPVANGGTGITSFGTGVATALGANVSGSGAICLASGSACAGGGSDPFDLSSITQTDTFAGNPTSDVIDQLQVQRRGSGLLATDYGQGFRDLIVDSLVRRRADAFQTAEPRQQFLGHRLGVLVRHASKQQQLK